MLCRLHHVTRPRPVASVWVNIQVKYRWRSVGQSDAGVQGQEIDVQQEDGVDEERLLRFEVITDEQRRSAVRRPEHATQLEDKINKQKQTFIKTLFGSEHLVL